MASLAVMKAFNEFPPGGTPPASYSIPRRFIPGRTGGDLTIKAATATVLARLRGQSLDDTIEELYTRRGDERLPMLVRSAANVADTTTPGWAQEVVGLDVQGFLASLPGSVFGALVKRGFVVDLTTNAAVSVPFRSGGTRDLAGAFVGENGAIPVSQTTLGSAALTRYKMAVISTITEELRTASASRAEAIIEALMATDTSRALDMALLDGAGAVAGVRPASIVNGVAALPASTAVSQAERIAEDVAAIITALVVAGCYGPFALVMNDAQRIGMALTLPGTIALDIIASPNVAPGDVFGIDVSQFAATASTPEFDVTNSAILVMVNADALAPTHATSAADSTAIGTADQVPPGGGVKVYDATQHAAGRVGENSVAASMFQQYALALRTVLPVSWVRGRAGAVQWVNGVAW
jgi:hypothetical protein